MGVTMAGQTAPPPPANPQRPVFRAGTNLVLVDAYPRRNGRIVPGLTADDFEVFENNTRQTIQQFDFVRVGPPAGERPDATEKQAFVDASEPRSRVFIVYLDADHVTMQGSRNIHAPLVDLIDRAMAPRDLFAVVSSRSPTDLRFGRAMLSMADRLGAFGTWGARDGKIPDPNDPVEKSIAGCFEAGVADGLIARRRQNAAIESLEQVVNYVAHIRQARTFILVVTEGWSLQNASASLIEKLQAGQLQNRPGVGVRGGTLRTVESSGHPVRPCEAEALEAASMDLNAQFRILLDMAHSANVTFYPVNPNGLHGPSLAARSGMASLGDDPLLSLAHDTDGEALLRPEHFNRGLAAAGPDISAYYLLGYVSPNEKPDGRLRTIRVRVKKPGISVSARRGYMAPTAEEVARTAALNAAINTVESGVSPEFDEAIGRLARAAPETELLATAAQWGEGGDLAVAVEIASGVQARGKWTRGAAVHVAVVDDRGDRAGEATGRIDAGARATLLRVHPAGDSGVWRVFVQVTGSDGQLDDRLLVDPARGALLGDPLIYRATPAAQSPLQPVVDGIFRRTERVHVEWPIGTALDRRDVRLLDERGRPVALAVSASDRESLGRPTLAVDVNLAPLAPGDYVIEVTAGKGAASEQHFAAFRVTR